MIIKAVLIDENLIQFLEERNLGKQYKKAKQFILNGHFKNIDLKFREPKKERIYYFRINNQFRAWGKLDESTLKIIKIDNHQN